MPAVSPETVWLPVSAALLSPGPDTTTDDALLVLQATVVEAGSVPVLGLVEIEPETVAAGATVTVAVCTTGPLGPCAVTV